MGTIADKLNYLKETKELIKDAIVSIGDDISDTDTFKDYANRIKEQKVLKSVIDGSVTSIKIPDGVTEIGNYVFYEKQLTNVELPDSVTTIGDYAFYKNINLKSIEFPTSLETIKQYAFAYCGLTELIIPSNIKQIDDYVFGHNVNLDSITIPATLTTIGKNLFVYCTGLTTAVFENGTTIIPYGIFQQCTGLTNVTIPEGVTRIDVGAFYKCSALKSIEIPTSVTSIGSNAFNFCAVDYFDFTKFTSIPVLDNANAFNSAIGIYVPDELYEEWQAATNWSSIHYRIFKASTMPTE